MRELVVGGWSRITGKAVWLAGLTVLIPTVALAQSAIVGVVKDSSGAAMPGVTVEASSDVLIEKVKSAVTDDGGTIASPILRPGTYSVTFTLTGFKTFRRDGLQLPSEFTATLNAELGVGALEETITVTGASPVVDVTSAAKTSVAQPRSDGPDSDRPQHPGHGAARRRRQPEPAGHRRRPRDAADLHVDARHEHVEHDGAGRRPDDQRPADRRRGAELLQRRDERRDELPDGGDRRRDLVGRRPPQHDSARRRQPVPAATSRWRSGPVRGSRAT